jgi:hypothetical protein
VVATNLDTVDGGKQMADFLVFRQTGTPDAL